MGTIKTEIDDLNDLTIQTVSGKVTVKELSDQIESFYAVTPTQLVLWDFSEADLSDIASSEVRTLVEFTRQYFHLREQGRTALVFSTDFAFGMGRMYDSIQGAAKTKIFHKSFHRKEEALEWLKGK